MRERIEPPSSYQNATPGSNRPHVYIRRVRRPNRPVLSDTRQFILAEHRPPFARAAITTPSTRRTNATLTDENRLSRGCLSDISSVSHDAWTRSAGRLAGYDRCSHPGRFIAPPEPPLKLTFAPPPRQNAKFCGLKRNHRSTTAPCLFDRTPYTLPHPHYVCTRANTCFSFLLHMPMDDNTLITCQWTTIHCLL